MCSDPSDCSPGGGRLGKREAGFLGSIGRCSQQLGRACPVAPPCRKGFWILFSFLGVNRLSLVLVSRAVNNHLEYFFKILKQQ